MGLFLLLHYMGKWIHRLSNKDTKAKTATCSNCGFVPISNKGTWRCVYSERYGSQASSSIFHKSSDRCEICNKIERLFYDHNHETGLFRGWLCHRCNVLIGFSLEDTEILKRAINYLEDKI